MNFDQLIKNWHAKAAEEDYFSKFVFEYLAFIAFLKKRKFMDEKSDRGAIQRLKQDRDTSVLYFQKLERKPELKRAWENIKAELDTARLGDVSRNSDEVEEIKWWNCSHMNPHQKSAEEMGKTMGVIHNLNDWENMVEFWHSIRNNLFHGGKNPQDARDQILVKNGYKTLRSMVEIFLSIER